MPFIRSTCYAHTYRVNNIYGYYVSNDGNDANDGLTPYTPWQTLAKVSAQTLVSGTTYHLRGGDTFAEKLHLQGTTPVRQVTVTSYGTGQATISCGDETGVHVDSVGNVTVDNLNIVGSGVTDQGVTTCKAWTAGVKCTNQTASILNNVHVTNCTITGCWDGILQASWDSVEGTNAWTPTGKLAGFDSCNITGNTISECAAIGIHFQTIGALDFSQTLPENILGSNLYIGNNVVHHIYGWSVVQEGAGAQGYGIIPAFVDGFVVEWNLVHHCGQNFTNPFPPNTGGPVAITPFNALNGLVQYNEIHHQYDTTLTDGEAIDCEGGSRDIIVQFNYCHDCDGPALFDSGVAGGKTTPTSGEPTQGQRRTWRYNLCVNNGGRSHSQISGYDCLPVAFFNPGSDQLAECRVYGNVFYNDHNVSANNIVNRCTSTDLIFANNIIIQRNSVGARLLVDDYGASPIVVGNLWDSEGDLAYTYNGTTHQTANASALVDMHNLGMEKHAGITYGIVAPALLANIGYDTDTFPVTGVTAYDPTALSPALAGGLNLLSLFGLDTGTIDFHGSAQRGTGVHDIGISDTTRPGIPGSLTVSAVTATSVTLTWSAVTSATSYKVYRGNSSGNQSTTPLATGVVPTTYSDSGLSTNTAKYYRVSAVVGGVEGPAATEVVGLTLPDVPTSLGATGGNTTVDLSLTPPSGSGLTYDYFRSLTSGTESSIASSQGATYQDTGRTNGVPLFYKAKARNASGLGAFSNEVTVTPTAPAPSSLLNNKVLYLAMDEASHAQRLDSTGNGIDFDDTVPNINQGAGHVSANSANFPPSGNPVLTTHSAPSSASTTKKSLSVWLNPTDLSVTRGVYDQDNGSGTDGNFIVGISTTGRLQVNYITNAVLTQTGKITAGVWNHVVIVFDGTQTDADPTTQNNKRLKIYVNGAVISSSDMFFGGAVPDHFDATTDPIHVGMNSYLGDHFYGLMETLYVADDAWTPTQVANLYNGGVGVPYPFTGVP